MHLQLSTPATNQPVNKIRKNMRQEGILQIISLIFLAALPRYFVLSPLVMVGYYCLYAILVSVSGYYLYKFYQFYQRLSTANLSTKEHLYGAYYEIRIHLEMYRSFTYIILVLMLGFATLYGLVDTPHILKSIQDKLNVNGIIVLAVALTGVVTLIGIVTECTLESYYGRYVKEIRQQIADLTAGE
ncbi:hypothetical protein HHL17_29180 [Chitinophaga sp. G-6-1-13]|uniref:DUF2721 domain-containing protein n=1 Tax=Chitinophaga fulva TaxID=2728842 RepID=A0A848GVT5_9BACT|nr:hypothetical protein [Chitinophaga fulva]NML41302.1 hypothetical protein [Chitinophaga fulva]